jgi:mannitol-specific phosphotransferase system IIBC component
MRRKSQKTLQNIKTLSDRVSDAEKPQRKYIKLAILELEKVRRSKEKNKAREQMINLDKRLAEIETEQARLMEAVYVVHPGVGSPAIGPPHAKKFIHDDNQDNTSQKIENNTDFKITY